MTRLMVLAVLAAALGACATAFGPAYGPARHPGDVGYLDRRIENNRFIVEYRADRRDYARAEDFAMHRAAELTLQNGYDWFQVISRNRAVSDALFDRHEESRYRDRRYGYPDRAYPDYREDRVGDGDARLEIVMGYNPPPRSRNIYEAERVLRRFANSR